MGLMQKVKVLALVAVVAAAVVAFLRRRELAAAGEWQTLGQTTSPAATPAPAPAEQSAPKLPEGYDPLTDPIPPNEL
jgi:hypothetical protein